MVFNYATLLLKLTILVVLGNEERVTNTNELILIRGLSEPVSGSPFTTIWN